MLVLLFNGSPVLFTQLRPGYRGKIFSIYKFRTMAQAKNTDGADLPDSVRITPFGNFLRKYSLDELPELLNIFFGQMSFVGPRPLLVQYLSRYNAEQNRRHDVLPGLTGWAQINGRNAISWDEKFKLDVWYVDHQSFWLDLKIMAFTLLKVIMKEGISQPGHATSEEFMGNDKI
jgi:sugar transferase EpsL